jgi:MoaD family protein
MAIEVRVPAMLRSVTGGQRVVYGEGGTVGALFENLEREYPGLRGQLFENGQPRRFVNIYVNDEDIRYLDKLDTSLHDGDVVSILPAVAGGA